MTEPDRQLAAPATGAAASANAASIPVIVAVSATRVATPVCARRIAQAPAIRASRTVGCFAAPTVNVTDVRPLPRNLPAARNRTVTR